MKKALITSIFLYIGLTYCIIIASPKGTKEYCFSDYSKADDSLFYGNDSSFAIPRSKIVSIPHYTFIRNDSILNFKEVIDYEFEVDTMAIDKGEDGNYIGHPMLNDRSYLSTPIPYNFTNFFDNIKQDNVDLYTGKFKENIHLYTVNDGSIAVPITMQYSTAGLPVNSIGSWVGNEWNLTSGGFVTRVVNGLPDECYEKIKINNRQIMAKGNLYFKRHCDLTTFFNHNTDTASVKKLIERADYMNPLNSGIDTAYDAKPDMFYALINGETITFYFGKNNAIITQPNINYTIVPVMSNPQNGITNIVGFTIEDGRGLKYHYGGVDLTSVDVTTVTNKSITFNYFHYANSKYNSFGIDYDQTKNTHIPFLDSLYSFAFDYINYEATPTIKLKNTYEVEEKRYETMFSYRSKWNLTKIESSDGDWIKFNYEGDEISYVNGRNQNFSIHNFAQLPVPRKNGSPIWLNISLFHDPTDISKLVPGEVLTFNDAFVNVSEKRIKSIETRTGAKVVFNESIDTRDDLKGGKALTEIICFDQFNKPIKTIKFGYRKVVCDDALNAWNNVYYLGHNRKSGSFKRHFYYHEDGTVHSVRENEQVQVISPNEDHNAQVFTELCRMFLISLEISGPETGGNNSSLNYEFLYNSKVEFPRRNSHQQDIFGFANKNPYNVNVRYSYIANTANFVNRVKLENDSRNTYKEPVFPPPMEDFEDEYGWLWYTGSNITGMWYNILQTSGNTTRFWGAVKTPNFEKASAWVLDSILYPYGGSKKVIYELNKNDADVIGGLRVKEIKLYSNMKEDYSLKYQYGVGYRSEHHNTFGLVYDLSKTYRGSGRSFSSQPVAGNYFTKGGVCGYDNVKVLEPSGGYKIYTFSSPKTISNEIVYVYDYRRKLYEEPDYRYPNPRKSEMDWKRGLLGNIAEYDNLNKKVKEKKFVYHFEKSNDPLMDLNAKYSEIAIKGQVISTTDPMYFYALTKYYFEDLKEKKIITYDYSYSQPSNNPDTIKVTREMHYKYPLFNQKKYSFLDSVITYYPDNKQTTEVFTRVGNYLDKQYPSSSIVKKLIDKNQFDAQIGYKKILKKGTGDQIVDGHVVDYAVFTEGLIKPKSKFNLPYSASNVNSEEYVNNSTGQIIIPEDFVEDVEFVNYDKNGRLNEFKDKESYPTSLIYSNIGPVSAKVTNSSVNSIAHIDFEDAKTLSGGFSNDDWETGYCSIIESDCFSGKKCFAFRGSSLKTKKTLPPGIYRIRMWTKKENSLYSGAINLEGFSGITWIATDNWQMQEKIITITASSKLTFNPTGSILVDDLSIIPYDAQIETFTWAPLVGMTSKTDNNGNTLFFSYDGLGRLTLVKDQDGNIRETHKYNIAQ